MEEIFSYSQYDQVLCLYFDNDESLIISRSSNRLISMEKVKTVDIDTISVKDKLLEFFKLHSISENQQTDDEKIRLSSIINFIKELKHDIIQEGISIFDKSQILFRLPVEWTEDKYQNDLRALFLKAGWINKEDYKSRLIFSTFIERLVHLLEMDDDYSIKLERERKYLLFYMGPSSTGLMCYQMQCAKELIGAPQKLAVSDFLLTPTVLDNEIICLSSLEKIIHNTIEKIFTIHQNANNISLKKSMLRTLTNIIFRNIEYIYEEANTEFYTPLATTLEYKDDETAKEYMEVLEGWNCSTLIQKISNDPDIEQLIQKIVATFKNILGEYNQVKNSPDGIQAIILYSVFHSRYQFYRNLFLDAKITDARIQTTINCSERYLSEAAMQKPYKMTQIANAFASPDILNKDNLSLDPNLIKHGWRENNLLLPNSFYVQAYVDENHIDFILNKVIVVSSIDDAAQKSTFTIEERSINVESVTDTICDIMWNHFQALDFEDYGHRVFRNWCDKHGVGEFNAENYFNFKANLKILMGNWFQDESMLSSEELDIYQSISININCKCALNITYRMLIELTLRPAITNIATVITSTLASNDLFGLYDVSALIIISESKNIALHVFNSILKEAILKRLQVHQKRLVVFHGEEELVACKSLGNWANDVKQILGRGSYLPLSSTSYMIDISNKVLKRFDKNFVDSFKFYEIPQIKQDCNFYLLKKDDYLYQEGVIKRLIYGSGGFIPPIEIVMLSSSQPGQSLSQIQFMGHIHAYSYYPVTIKISPQHYSSTVKIVVSWVIGGDEPTEAHESITISEKLVLQQQ